ncbi:MAG: serine/threonine-protein kinase [Pirellulales bacterium]
MTNGDTTDRGENLPAFLESDHTVISSGGPLALQPVAEGMHPRELGHALEGQQLDHVVLEEFVGGGGMGAVFRAWDTDLHRTVAVKVLSSYQTADADTERRFQIEGRSAARLDHPNIARVHYIGQALGVRYIVFEFIEGTNIRDLVNATGPLPIVDALNYTLQIAGALVHAFQRDVVHRDIKPSNILITPDGLAKLVDMGLARYEQVDREHDETATGVTLGTFDYIAPEQARNPRQADTRSDIYSLGCTLFFMLTGQPPFKSGTATQKLLQHQETAPPDVRQFRPDVPKPLADILARLLAKRPEERFSEPSALVAALAASTDWSGIPRPLLAWTLLGSSWRPPATRWRRHAAWLVPTVLLALTVFALAVSWSGSETSPTFPPLQIPEAPTAAGNGK